MTIIIISPLADSRYMNIEITSSVKDSYLLINSAGALQTDADLFAHATMLYEEMIKYGKKKILLNLTGTSFPKTLFSYLELVKYYQLNLPANIVSYKIAAVLLPEYKEIGSFWETASINRGIPYYIFTSLREAEIFLLK